jgi:hypothetical protein
MFLVYVDSMIPRVGVVDRLPFTVFIRISISDIESSRWLLLSRKRASTS